MAAAEAFKREAVIHVVAGLELTTKASALRTSKNRQDVTHAAANGMQRRRFLVMMVPLNSTGRLSPWSEKREARMRGWQEASASGIGAAGGQTIHWVE